MILFQRKNKKKSGVCFIATVSFPIKFHMGPHIKKISENYDVTVIGSDVSVYLANFFSSNVKLNNVNITRKPNFISDVTALFQLIKIFRDNEFSCIHSVTPKAGLLSMIAGFLVGIPIRIHTFTGQVWVSEQGLTKIFYAFIDRVIAFFSTLALADSNSQREFLISSGIVCAEKIHVLGHGSIVGVDCSRFKPDASKRVEIRQSLGIGFSDFVFIFVGRLTIDKGVADLLVAFNEITKKCIKTHLLIVGPDEADFDTCITTAYKNLSEKIHRVKFTENPEWYMAASDILCLPSYREGFGSVVIESAAVGIPSIVSRIYGLNDAVIEGETGIFHEAGNISELTKVMFELYANQSLRDTLGFNARNNASKNFSQALLTKELEALYLKLGVT